MSYVYMNIYHTTANPWERIRHKRGRKTKWAKLLGCKIIPP